MRCKTCILGLVFFASASAQSGFGDLATDVFSHMSLIQYLVNAGVYLATAALFFYAYILYRAHLKNPYFVSSTKIIFIAMMALVMAFFAWHAPQNAEWMKVKPIPTVKKTHPKIQESPKAHWSKSKTEKTSG